MNARTAPQTMVGATLALSASLPATYDSAGYEASAMVYTLLGEVDNFGNHGTTAKIAEYTPVATGVVGKAKGSKNYGNITVGMGSVPSNAGQTLLEAAVESSAHYSAKMTYPDGEIHYMDVLVSKKEYQDGAADGLSKISAVLEICRKPVVVAAV